VETTGKGLLGLGRHNSEASHELVQVDHVSSQPLSVNPVSVQVLALVNQRVLRLEFSVFG
jgi:hypothetical protein